MNFSYKGVKPQIADDVFIASGAQVIGDVEIGAGSSFWPNAVARGDVNKIRIGQNTNVQDNSSLHVDANHPLVIGDNVTIGHNAIVHGCKIENNVLIGMGAIILDGAKIGAESLIGAGALVVQGKEIPPRSLVIGSPGKVVRQLSEEEVEGLHKSASGYAEKAQIYRTQVKPIS